MAAATDNVGLFFGEDIFLAIASILLIQGSLASFGIQLTPFQLSVWAIPTRDLRLPDPRRAAAAARPSAGAAANDQPALALRARRRGVRRLRGRQRSRRDQSEALGQRRSSGRCSAVSFWFGDFLGDLGNGVLVLALVGVAGAHLLGRGAKQSTTSKSASEFVRPLWQQALPAGADHSVHGVRRHACCSTTRRSRAPGLIDPKAVTLVLLGCRRHHRADRLLRLAAAAGCAAPVERAAG